MEIFSVYDSKADAYLQPFFSRNMETAIRDFKAAVNDSTRAGNNFYLYSEDYTLFCIGRFDENQGTIEAYVPKALMNALQLRVTPGEQLINGNQ